MIPGPHASTGGSSDSLGREMADMRRRIADLARAFAALGKWTTWTPDYTYGGAARAPTTPVGRYVKLGSTAILEFSFFPQSTEVGSAVVLTNLPFTVSTSQVANLIPKGVAWNDNAPFLIGVFPDNNSTTALLARADNAAISLNSASRVYGSLHYEAV